MNRSEIIPYLLSRWYIVLPIVILFVCLLLWFFTPSGPDPVIKKIEANISEQKGVNAVITNETVNAQKDVNNAEINTNRALDNLNRSINRDSGTFAGNSTDRFCERFPNDSTCADWRERRGIR